MVVPEDLLLPQCSSAPLHLPLSHPETAASLSVWETKERGYLGKWFSVTAVPYADGRSLNLVSKIEFRALRSDSRTRWWRTLLGVWRSPSPARHSSSHDSVAIRSHRSPTRAATLRGRVLLSVIHLLAIRVLRWWSAIRWWSVHLSIWISAPLRWLLVLLLLLRRLPPAFLLLVVVSVIPLPVLSLVIIVVVVVVILVIIIVVSVVVGRLLAGLRRGPLIVVLLLSRLL